MIILKTRRPSHQGKTTTPYDHPAKDDLLDDLPGYIYWPQLKQDHSQPGPQPCIIYHVLITPRQGKTHPQGPRGQPQQVLDRTGCCTQRKILTTRQVLPWVPENEPGRQRLRPTSRRVEPGGIQLENSKKVTVWARKGKRYHVSSS